jgi:beta-mannosidase
MIGGSGLMTCISLNEGWRLFEAPLSWQKDRLAQVLRGGGALPCDLPADVRMPLIAAGKIADPVEADNFRRSKWVEDRSWWFVKSFGWQGGGYDAVELAMERLDFGADILLNGEIGRAHV